MSSPLRQKDFPFEVHPLTGRIGARIEGVNLSGSLEPELARNIWRALLRYKVIFFRDQQHLNDTDQEALGHQFGELVAHPTLPSLSGSKFILELDAERGARANIWHSDMTFLDAYPRASILKALVVPAYGGDTIWANTATAYQALPAALRDLADRLWALHSNAGAYGREEKRDPARRKHLETFTSKIYETEHPVVRVHPETGERTLVLGQFVQGFLDLPSADSAQIFSLLQSYVTRSENTVRWRWSVGDLAIWDNRATQHFGVDDYGSEPRIMRRVTIAGDLPIGVDQRTSVTHARSGAAAAL